MIAPLAPRSKAVAPIAVLFALGSCSVYDASLVRSGSSSGGGGSSMGQSGTSGTPGGASGGTGDGDVAGEAAVNGGSAGSGGLSGESGAGGAGPSTEAGTGGVGGSGAGGAAAGAGGAASGSGGATAGAGGANQTAKGCAKLTIPLDDAADKAHIVITLTSPTDLSGATISTRLYVQAGAGGTIFNYVQDSGTYHFLGVPTAQRQKLSGLSGWSIVTWNVGAEDPGSTNIVKTSIKNIGIEVNALPSTSWLNPTIIYIDSITVGSTTLSFTFDASSSVYPTPTNANVAGQALWLNSGATDTTAVGATVSWQATCP